jgi:hypothetical protein
LTGVDQLQLRTAGCCTAGCALPHKQYHLLLLLLLLLLECEGV